MEQDTDGKGAFYLPNPPSYFRRLSLTTKTGSGTGCPRPFRDGAAKPVLDKVGTVPDMAVAPRRLVIRGTLFSDFFPALFRGVWDKWVAFTETSEKVRGSAVLWDLTLPDRMAKVPSGDTALNRRAYYWMVVQGRIA
ncbi:hypothetical protein GSI_10192 [Ganoderma sinense ZZ0214-1]|uniref:Uncharacterized protein n=1 Tax=Ganoderma sinense ZZ0214-1 TaxID=1077348 RepID=A0A2G8RZV3_9APHY|nr:hypothetical protein GSI_10192 [Ganoderma sinense ZZ0214-1]